jgi:tetratricopeptide (TPR) repeat protein
MERKLVMAQQAKLAEARAQYKASRPKDTLAITTELAPEVLAAKHLPTEAELHLLAGQALWVLEGADKGEPELMQAAADADAGRADSTKLEAWLQLTNLATDSAHFDVAMQRLQFASAALARLGDPWSWKVRVLGAHALLDSRQNKYDEAIALAKQARLLAEPHSDSRDYAYALLIEASILGASAHAAEAVATFRKVLAYQEALGHDRYETAATLQNLAASELELGRIDDAVGHAKTALAIDEAVYGPDSTEVARVLGAIAVAQGAKGDHDGALATYQRALAIVTKTAGSGDDQYAQLLGQLAGELLALGRTKEALPYYDQAIAIQTKRLGAGHLQTLISELMKCDAQQTTGAIPDAVATCSHALAGAEKAVGRDSPILYQFLLHTGSSLLDAKRARDASPLLERALAIGGTNPADVDDTAFLTARAQWELGDRKLAVQRAHQARDGYAKLGDDKRQQLAHVDEWLKSHAN